MAEVDTYRSADRRAVEALYRRVFGTDAAEASRLRWDGIQRRNPNNPGGTPVIWIAREGPTIVGQDATMPVRLWVGGREVDASWGMDVMVAPERQRQGIGEVLFRTWDRNTGASLGLGLSESSHRLFQKLRWPEPGPVPCLVKPLTRRAFRRANWPESVNRLVSAVTLPLVKVVSRTRPLRAEIEMIRRFPPEFSELWERTGAKVRLRRPARCALSQLEVHRSTPRAVPCSRAQARGPRGGLCGLPPPARAARPCHELSWTSWSIRMTSLA